MRDVVRRSSSRATAWVAAVLACCLVLAGCSAGSPTSTSAFGTRTAQAGASWAGGRPTATVAAVAPHGHQPFHRLAADVGRLLDTTLSGPASGVTLRVWIWLPPQYDDPA
ncbi:MAG TPA: hypothetical protein VI248_20120, partial [Kineosporiaceae bacterium]